MSHQYSNYAQLVGADGLALACHLPALERWSPLVRGHAASCRECPVAILLPDFDAGEIRGLLGWATEGGASLATMRDYGVAADLLLQFGYGLDDGYDGGAAAGRRGGKEPAEFFGMPGIALEGEATTSEEGEGAAEVSDGSDRPDESVDAGADESAAASPASPESTEARERPIEAENSAARSKKRRRRPSSRATSTPRAGREEQEGGGQGKKKTLYHCNLCPHSTDTSFFHFRRHLALKHFYQEILAEVGLEGTKGKMSTCPVCSRRILGNGNSNVLGHLAVVHGLLLKVADAETRANLEKYEGAVGARDDRPDESADDGPEGDAAAIISSAPPAEDSWRTPLKTKSAQAKKRRWASSGAAPPAKARRVSGGERKGLFQCQSCQNTFSSLTSLRKHLACQHFRQKIFSQVGLEGGPQGKMTTCPVCSNTILGNGNFNMLVHLALVHDLLLKVADDETRANLELYEPRRRSREEEELGADRHESALDDTANDEKREPMVVDFPQELKAKSRRKAGPKSAILKKAPCPLCPARGMRNTTELLYHVAIVHFMDSVLGEWDGVRAACPRGCGKEFSAAVGSPALRVAVCRHLAVSHGALREVVPADVGEHLDRLPQPRRRTM